MELDVLCSQGDQFTADFCSVTSTQARPTMPCIRLVIVPVYELCMHVCLYVIIHQTAYIIVAIVGYIHVVMKDSLTHHPSSQTLVIQVFLDYLSCTLYICFFLVNIELAYSKFY